MERKRHKLFMRRPGLENLPPMPLLPTGHELREARSDDDRALADVMVSAFGSDWSVERVRRSLLDAEDVKHTFLVTTQGVPVATASARLLLDRFPGSGYVHWVATHADHRGKHLGKEVFLAVLQSFTELGCVDAVLETDPPRLPPVRLHLNLASFLRTCSPNTKPCGARFAIASPSFKYSFPLRSRLLGAAGAGAAAGQGASRCGQPAATCCAIAVACSPPRRALRLRRAASPAAPA